MTLHERMWDAFERIQEFIKLADQARTIAESEADWETKYDLIFSPYLSQVIRSLEIQFEWYDPDTTYEADVRAYVSAISAKADELRKIKWE